MPDLTYEYNWLKRLTALAKQDRIYQQMYAEAEALEAAFLEIFPTLPESQRQIIEHYFSSCEELDYYLMQLSYEMGKRDL